MNAHPPLASPARRGGTSRRLPRGRGTFRPRGSEIRGLISELRELTGRAESVRLERGRDAALSETRIEIERKQSRLAELVRRDPTFGRAAYGAAPDAHAMELAYDDHAQRGLEHEEAVAATAVQLGVSVHRVERAVAASELPPPVRSSR